MTCFALKMIVKSCALTLESLSLNSVESLDSRPGITKMPALSFPSSRKHQNDLCVFKNCLGFLIHADIAS